MALGVKSGIWYNNLCDLGGEGAMLLPPPPPKDQSLIPGIRIIFSFFILL
jgi:hypothetical protein